MGFPTLTHRSVSVNQRLIEITSSFPCNVFYPQRHVQRYLQPPLGHGHIWTDLYLWPHLHSGSPQQPAVSLGIVPPGALRWRRLSAGLHPQPAAVRLPPTAHTALMDSLPPGSTPVALWPANL